MSLSLKQTKTIQVSECNERRTMPNFPFIDCSFVEDNATVFEHTAVINQPGHPSRRGEVAAIEKALKQVRMNKFADMDVTLTGFDPMIRFRL